MTHSPELRAFVAGWEDPPGGPPLVAYDDGGGVMTIGHGHTRGVRLGDTCTTIQADAWLDDELAVAGNELARYVKRQATQQQWDALVSLGYNCGVVGKDRIGESGLMALFNVRRDQECADRFLMWNRDAGVVNAGLSRRRAAERAMYLFGNYEGRP